MREPPGPRLDPTASAILRERLPHFKEMSDRLLGAVMPFLPSNMETAIVALLSEATMLCRHQTVYGPYKPEEVKKLAEAILSYFLSRVFEDEGNHRG